MCDVQNFEFREEIKQDWSRLVGFGRASWVIGAVARPVHSTSELVGYSTLPNAGGEMPLDFLLRLMRDLHTPLPRRLEQLMRLFQVRMVFPIHGVGVAIGQPCYIAFRLKIDSANDSSLERASNCVAAPSSNDDRPSFE